MWKSIKNISSAVKDICIVAGKEISFQTGKASNTTNNVTGKLASKAHHLRENYEVNLTSRKEGVDGEIVVVRPSQHKEA
jgi:hypothetical protein